MTPREIPRLCALCPQRAGGSCLSTASIEPLPEATLRISIPVHERSFTAPSCQARCGGRWGAACPGGVCRAAGEADASA